MQIVIQAKNLILTAGLRGHVERRLGFALDWARHRPCKVAVRLSAINGPRGGRDKRCQIQVSIPGAADVVVENTADDLYVAIDWAVKRAARALLRQVERKREIGCDTPGGANAHTRVTAGAFLHPPLAASLG